MVVSLVVVRNSFWVSVFLFNTKLCNNNIYKYTENKKGFEFT